MLNATLIILSLPTVLFITVCVLVGPDCILCVESSEGSRTWLSWLAIETALPNFWARKYICSWLIVFTAVLFKGEHRNNHLWWWCFRVFKRMPICPFSYKNKSLVLKAYDFTNGIVILRQNCNRTSMSPPRSCVQVKIHFKVCFLALVSK